jgi:hypothetical protein
MFRFPFAFLGHPSYFSDSALGGSERKLHEFYFRTFLFGTSVALDAFELRDGNPAGYQFQVTAEHEEEHSRFVWLIDREDAACFRRQAHRRRRA